MKPCTDGKTAWCVSKKPRFLRRRWADLDHDALHSHEAWCPSCGNEVLRLRGVLGREVGTGTQSVMCWIKCPRCEMWTLLDDEEIFGVKVLTPQECEIARVMDA